MEVDTSENEITTVLESVLDSVSKDALAEAVIAYQKAASDAKPQSTAVRLPPKTKAFYSAMAADLGISTSAVINLVLAGNVSMTIEALNRQSS